MAVVLVEKSVFARSLLLVEVLDVELALPGDEAEVRRSRSE